MVNPQATLNKKKGCHHQPFFVDEMIMYGSNLF